MDTYFAPAERDTPEQIAREVSRISNNALIDSLMKSIRGLLAVVNDKRQILAVNDAFLKMLGVEDADKVLGLRPGEAIDCIHAHEEEGGCGTTKYCSACGAAIAMVTCLAQHEPVEEKCVATVKRHQQEVDLCLKVRACPLTLGNQSFILLFLQDNTNQERWAALERAFFHDITNTLSGLVGASELLILEDPEEKIPMARLLHQQANRLEKEIAIQRALAKSNYSNYQVQMEDLSCRQIMEEVAAFFKSHPAACGKTILLPEEHSADTIRSDASLLTRILTNMVLNALEASGAGDTVRIWLEAGADNVSFHVWNRQEIAEPMQLRVFQRHFSTKEGVGRGTGTFSMKLFGETFLHGRVGFTSSAEAGTTFTISLPR